MTTDGKHTKDDFFDLMDVVARRARIARDQDALSEVQENCDLASSTTTIDTEKSEENDPPIDIVAATPAGSQLPPDRKQRNVSQPGAFSVKPGDEEEGNALPATTCIDATTASVLPSSWNDYETVVEATPVMDQIVEAYPVDLDALELQNRIQKQQLVCLLKQNRKQKHQLVCLLFVTCAVVTAIVLGTILPRTERPTELCGTQIPTTSLLPP